jgi:hypothetical protein
MRWTTFCGPSNRRLGGSRNRLGEPVSAQPRIGGISCASVGASVPGQTRRCLQHIGHEPQPSRVGGETPGMG